MHDAFINEKIRVVVGTVAYGMGIDKPDVRYVVHTHMPGRLEAYYQEAGRAGRDGKQARCEVLWTRDDLKLLRLIVADDRRLDPLLRYLTAFGCRRALLLAHFGESMRHCGGCDRCEKWQRWFKRKSLSPAAPLRRLPSP